jgi:AcrR family transcriptional regulator
MKASRKERERELRRQEIVSAAKVVFAKKGFHGAALEEIATEAEFSKAALYTYFKDKHDLLYAVLEDGLERLFAKVSEIRGAELPPLSKLDMMVKGAVEFMEEDRDFFRVFTREEAGMADVRHTELRKRVLPRLMAFIEVAASVIQQGIDEGVIREVNPRVTANLLLGMVHSAAVSWLLEGARESLADKSQVITDVLLDGIRKRKGKA